MGKRKSVLVTLDNDHTLAKEVIENALAVKHIINLGSINVETFSDGETCVDFETSVRKNTVYILCSPNTAEKIIQLEFAIDAARRASAKAIIPILPYFPYARQDKKDQARGPIGAKVIASKLEMLGATTIITFDLHADQIQGFFQIPVNHMDGKYLFVPTIKTLGLDNLVLVSPDAGGGKRVKHFRDLILRKYDVDLPIVFMDKTRKKANEIDKMVVIGDVLGKRAIIIDDMADTCGTLCTGAKVLKEDGGAISVSAIVTHAVLSSNAYEKIQDSVLDSFICSNTLPLKEGRPSFKIKVESIAHQIMLAILAIDKGLSIENLKENEEYN